MPSWGSAALFANSPSFLAERITWPYALALTTLGLAVILTAVVRENFPAPFPWAGTLTLIGFGLLAVLADNPLTLVLVWAGLDLTELITQLASAWKGEAPASAWWRDLRTRALGIGLLLWAGLTSLWRGVPLDFRSPLPEAGVFLILAAGLRLGVLPLHLAYATESTTTARLWHHTATRLSRLQPRDSGTHPRAGNLIPAGALPARTGRAAQACTAAGCGCARPMNSQVARTG